MKKYDLIIAGGGAAGLSLAFYLSRSVLNKLQVLIIDKDRKDKNDRTWGFWTRHQTVFDSVIASRFSKLAFHSSHHSRIYDLQDYHYNIIRGIDFYRFIKEQLAKLTNFEFLNTTVQGIQDNPDGGLVKTTDGDFGAKWIFSSIFNESEVLRAAQSKLYLRQHFKGWFIKTRVPVFDPGVFNMFDFRTPQSGVMRFFYVIPTSASEALVEYTLFSERLLELRQYEDALRSYIGDVLKVNDYEILDEEFGIIPMTNYLFPASQGKHIVNIGSAGGSSKPSSGYTFMRIQKHVQKIVGALEAGKSPVISANSAIRYRFYDSVLLNILKNHGEMSEEIFSKMFKNNTIRQVFNFLDEEGGLKNDLKMITSLPPWPFLRSTVDLLVNQKL